MPAPVHLRLVACRIAGSMSEDSGSCMSSRDVSPAGKLRRRRRRERRLPTFINLGNGTTLTAERKDGGPTNASHSSVTQSVGEVLDDSRFFNDICSCRILKITLKLWGGVYFVCL